MAFNQNIPQPTDPLSVSQPQLLDNNMAVNSWVNVNHVGFNVSDSGKHNFVELVYQSSAPTLLSGEGGIFNADIVSPSGTSEIYFTQPSTGLEYPVTASILSTVSIPTALENGFSYLPSGIILKWGNATGLIPGVNTITLVTSPSAGPSLNQVLNCQLTTNSAPGSSATYSTFNVGLQTLTINITGTATACQYLIVGF